MNRRGHGGQGVACWSQRPGCASPQNGAAPKHASSTPPSAHCRGAWQACIRVCPPLRPARPWPWAARPAPPWRRRLRGRSARREARLLHWNRHFKAQPVLPLAGPNRCAASQPASQSPPLSPPPAAPSPGAQPGAAPTLVALQHPGPGAQLGAGQRHPPSSYSWSNAAFLARRRSASSSASAAWMAAAAARVAGSALPAKRSPVDAGRGRQGVGRLGARA